MNEEDAQRWESSPFHPGQGVPPPVWAGRNREMRGLQADVLRLAKGGAPDAFAILHAPRGYGKTALINWMRDAAEKAKVATLLLTPSDIPTRERLIRILTGVGQRMADLQGRLRIEAEDLDALEVEGRGGRKGPSTVQEALLVASRRRPLAICVDEAHTLDEAVGRALLNGAQSAARKGALHLVIAGTGGLKDALRAMNATFWERSEKYALRRLTPTEAQRAIAQPLKEAGADVRVAAVEAVADAAQGYPYFVQVLGRELWVEAANGPVGPQGAAAALHRFAQLRDDLYNDRYAALDEADAASAAPLMLALLAVADWFDEDASRQRDILTDGLQAALTELNAPGERTAALSAYRQLRSLDLLWESEGGRVRSGIPSLMNHIANAVAKRPQMAAQRVRVPPPKTGR